MRIEYHASPDGERSVVIDCEDMVPGLEAKPWIDGWMRGIQHLMPDNPPGTVVVNNSTTTPCVDGSATHDFKGKSVCPLCGLSLSWYLCQQPAADAPDKATLTGDDGAERTIVLPIDQERSESPPALSGGMNRAFQTDLQLLINIYKGFVNDPDVREHNDKRIRRLEHAVAFPSRPYPT